MNSTQANEEESFKTCLLCGMKTKKVDPVVQISDEPEVRQKSKVYINKQPRRDQRDGDDPVLYAVRKLIKD